MIDNSKPFIPEGYKYNIDREGHYHLKRKFRDETAKPESKRELKKK